MATRFFCDMCDKEIKIYETAFPELHLEVTLQQKNEPYNFGVKSICEKCAEKVLLLFNEKPKHPNLERARTIAHQFSPNKRPNLREDKQ